MNLLWFLWEIKMHPQYSLTHGRQSASDDMYGLKLSFVTILIHTYQTLHIVDFHSMLLNEWDYRSNWLYYKSDVFHFIKTWKCECPSFGGNENYWGKVTSVRHRILFHWTFTTLELSQKAEKWCFTELLKMGYFFVFLNFFSLPCIE